MFLLPPAHLHTISLSNSERIVASLTRITATTWAVCVADMSSVTEPSATTFWSDVPSLGMPGPSTVCGSNATVVAADAAGAFTATSAIVMAATSANAFLMPTPHRSPAVKLPLTTGRTYRGVLHVPYTAFPGQPRCEVSFTSFTDAGPSG